MSVAGTIVAHMMLTPKVALTQRERSRGLLGRSELSEGESLLFLHCRSVHTIGMGFTIAVVHLDAKGRVHRVTLAPPGRLILPRWRTRHILECRPEDAPKVGAVIPLQLLKQDAAGYTSGGSTR